MRLVAPMAAKGWGCLTWLQSSPPTFDKRSLPQRAIAREQARVPHTKSKPKFLVFGTLDFEKKIKSEETPLRKQRSLLNATGAVFLLRVGFWLLRVE